MFTVSGRVFHRYFAPLDFLAALLVILVVTVQVGAIWAAADPLQAVEKPAPVETGENNATTSIPILVVFAVETVVAYALYLLYRRMPGIVKRWTKRVIKVVVSAYAVLYAVLIMPALFAVYGAMALAWVSGYRWVAYNLAALTLAIVVAATLGGYFGPVPVAILLLALMAYDWIAVFDTTIMDRLVRFTAATRIPAVIVFPKRLDFDIEHFFTRLASTGTEERESISDGVYLVIGAGDFAIPAALTAAVFRFHPSIVAVFVLIGSVVGMILLRSVFERSDEALPGLPWLAGGALCGYSVGIACVKIIESTQTLL